jgi:hypothetical protein
VCNSDQSPQRRVKGRVLQLLEMLQIDSDCVGGLLLAPTVPLAQAGQIRREGGLRLLKVGLAEHSHGYRVAVDIKTSRMG